MINPITKQCTKCKENKELSDFHKHNGTKDGLYPLCKICRKINDTNYRLKNKKEIATQKSVYYIENKKEINTKTKKYYQEHKIEISLQKIGYNALHKEEKATYGAMYGPKWRKRNRGKVNAKASKRRAVKLKATPKWLTKEQYKEMESLYIEAVRLTIVTGIPHEVDHIVPLQGRDVSGLHVPWNLKVIPRSVNRSKNNKLIPLAQS